MCDFHSTVWRMLGDKIEMLHDPSNSHSEMIAKAGWRDNEPNRQTIVFEAEWSGNGDVPSDGSLIRNSGECPEQLVSAIRRHYDKIKEAINDGKHFDRYFADTEKWCDVWNAAIAARVRVILPAVFKGNLAVYGGAKLDALALTKVGGNLAVYGGAELDALTEVGGYLDVYGGAKLDAPALTKVDGNLDVHGGAELDAPALTKVGGNLAVYGSAKLDAPALTKVGGYLDVSGSAKLDALTEVGGNLAVHGELIASKLKRK